MNRIVTNGAWRELMCYEELEPWERDVFEDKDSLYFTYKGDTYALNSFMKTDHFKGWHGALSLTALHGIVIAVNDFGDAVKVGVYG
jgi:hypothetical protein